MPEFRHDIPTGVLVVSCIATAACVPSFFIPARPKTPPSASSDVPKTPVMKSLKIMLRSPSFYIVFWTFSIYVGFFNAFSTLINQFFAPYGYTEDEAGIAGGLLLGVGIVVAALTIPIIDRTHAYLLGIKILCPLLALSYLAMIWAPQTRSVAAPYILCAVLGATSFPLLPITLEYLVEITFPASPEVSSTICWVGGQVLGGVFIIAMNALKDTNGGGDQPPGNMFKALVFQAVVCLAVLPLPLMLGIKRLGLATKEGRLKKDVDGDSVVTSVEGVEEGRGPEE
jgi:FLVCR family MFS transporter 7